MFEHMTVNRKHTTYGNQYYKVTCDICGLSVSFTNKKLVALFTVKHISIFHPKLDLDTEPTNKEGDHDRD